MEFDMEVKRAERLLRKNWETCKKEAHKLGALGINVEVRDNHLLIGNRDNSVVVTQTGDVSVYYNDEFHHEAGIHAVADLLNRHLEGIKDGATALAEVSNLFRGTVPDSVEMAKKKQEIARLRNLASWQYIELATGFRRQAEKPAYPGQDIICLEKASQVERLSRENDAKADVLWAELMEELAGREED